MQGFENIGNFTLWELQILNLDILYLGSILVKARWDDDSTNYINGGLIM